MKAQVVFDADGKIVAMYHMSHAPSSPKMPVVTLRPEAGQHLATLDVPTALHHLKPAELHASVHVDRSGSSPQLIRKPKK